MLVCAESLQLRKKELGHKLGQLAFHRSIRNSGFELSVRGLASEHGGRDKSQLGENFALS